MSNVVPKPVFLVGSWVRAARHVTEHGMRPWRVLSRQRDESHDGYVLVLTRHSEVRGEEEYGRYAERDLVSVGLEAWIPDTPAGTFGLDRSDPPPHCATCGKVHGPLCAHKIDRILKRRVLDELKPATSVHFDTAPDLRPRCPSLHCDRPVSKLDSGMYFCPSCSWHGKSVLPRPEPRFKVGDRVNDACHPLPAWQVMAIWPPSSGGLFTYDIAWEGKARHTTFKDKRVTEDRLSPLTPAQVSHGPR